MLAYVIVPVFLWLQVAKTTELLFQWLKGEWTGTVQTDVRPYFRVGNISDEEKDVNWSLLTLGDKSRRHSLTFRRLGAVCRWEDSPEFTFKLLGLKSRHIFTLAYQLVESSMSWTYEVRTCLLSVFMWRLAENCTLRDECTKSPGVKGGRSLWAEV